MSSHGGAGASGHPEIEQKFDVGMDTPVPDLDRVPSVVAVSTPDTSNPSSTYFDTTDLDLARRRITVRRRTGSSDAGWHVKLPVASDERLELRSPLSAGGNNTRVPAEVADRVAAVTRGKSLVPVAVIDTRRITTVVSTADHAAAAELCDDTVTARNLLDDVTTRWREWEVELVDGKRSILRKIGKTLLAHGGSPGSSTSKLARAMGSRLSDALDRSPRGGRELDGTAGAAVLRALAADVDVDVLTFADPLVRIDAHDSVHAMRVATRRLRSVLRSYRTLFDRPTVDAIRDELSWLADLLGTARDAEVMAERFGSALDALEPDAVRGPVREALQGTQKRLYALAHDEIVTELNGERYFALLEALDGLLLDPPLVRGNRPHGRTFRKVLRKQYRAVVAAETRAAELTGAAHEDALHDVRKSAKKLRYAAEAALAAPSGGRLDSDAAAVGKAAKKVQSVLGDHHDSAVARETLLVETGKAHDAGADTFTFGVLYADEAHMGASALEPLDGARRKLSVAGRALKK